MNSAQQIKYWSPALACLVCQGICMGMATLFGFFIVPLSNEFDVSVAQLTIAPAIMVIVTSLFSPVIGPWLDRITIKKVMLAGVVLLMGSVAAMSFVPNIKIAAMAYFVFSLGILCTGPMVNNTLLIKIYHHDLGKALSVAAMGVSISSIALPLCVAWLLDAHGWRTTLQILSAVLSVIVATTILLFIPSKIEENEVDQPQENKSPANRSYLRDRNFWLIGLAMAVIFSGAMVLGVIYPPHFEQVGFSVKEAAMLISMGGAGGIIGKIIVALVADRFTAQLKWVALCFLLSIISGISLLFVLESFVPLWIAIFFIGCGGGGLLPLHPFLNAAYFDASIIGEVNGAQMPIFLPLMIVGPPLVGFSFDQTGNYFLGLSGILGFLVVGGLFLVSLGRASQTTRPDVVVGTGS